MFFQGFMGQVKMAFDKERRWPTITVWSTFTLIIVFGFWTENAVIGIILLLIQWCGISWYVSAIVPSI